MDLALDAAVLGQGQHRLLAVLGEHLADNPALDVQAATELQVATDHHLRADQGVDLAGGHVAGFAFQHQVLSPFSEDWTRVGWTQATACSSDVFSPRNDIRTCCGTKPSGRITLPSSCWKYRNEYACGGAASRWCRRSQSLVTRL